MSRAAQVRQLLLHVCYMGSLPTTLVVSGREAKKHKYVLDTCHYIHLIETNFTASFKH